ncbi:hypothetical protein HUT19_16125 [Streptomyces sp. NA02950]|nr:hypothetical protein HUT19_16125 [Streptomyces sp. NA02950]
MDAREDDGLSYEDYVVGHVSEHQPGRTITATDDIWSSLLCLNQHPLHIDDVYASGTPFKKPLVSSLVTFGIVSGMTVKTISQKAVANLGWDNVGLNAPVIVGDTLHAETTIAFKRLSATRPGEGIVATSGCTWWRLPPVFGPSGPTAHRRFTEWSAARVWAKLDRRVLDELGSRGELDWSRCAIDSVILPASSTSDGSLPGRRGRRGCHHGGHGSDRGMR